MWILLLAGCASSPHRALLPAAAGLPADPHALVDGPEPMPPAPAPLDTPIAAAVRPAPGPIGVHVAIAVPPGLASRLLAERIRAAIDPGTPAFVDVAMAPGAIRVVVRAHADAELVASVLQAVASPALSDDALATALWPYRDDPDVPDPDTVRALATASASRARVAVVVTGPLRPEDVQSAIAAVTSRWPDGAPLAPTPAPDPEDRGTRVRRAATPSGAADAWLTAWRAGTTWDPGT